MSTTTPPTARPGHPTNRPDPNRYTVADEVTTANAPRTFDTTCTHRLPNPVSKENLSTPQ
jgi:hypothetical protein